MLRSTSGLGHKTFNLVGRLLPQGFESPTLHFFVLVEISTDKAGILEFSTVVRILVICVFSVFSVLMRQI